MIDSKRAQNLGIVLGTMKMSYDDIKQAIVNMDEDLINVNIVQQLVDLAPTQEEVI